MDVGNDAEAHIEGSPVLSHLPECFALGGLGFAIIWVRVLCQANSYAGIILSGTSRAGVTRRVETNNKVVVEALALPPIAQPRAETARRRLIGAGVGGESGGVPGDESG